MKTKIIANLVPGDVIILGNQIHVVIKLKKAPTQYHRIVVTRQVSVEEEIELHGLDVADIIK